MLTGSRSLGMCVCAWLSKIEFLNTEAETCYSLDVTGMVCLQSWIIHELKRSSTTWILQLIKSYETEPPGRRLTTCWASACGPFRLGKPGVWGSGEKSWSQKRRLPIKKWSRKEKHQRGDLGSGGRSRRSGRWVETSARGAWGPWPRMPKARSREQWHSRTWTIFLPTHHGAATLWEGHGGQGEAEKQV